MGLYPHAHYLGREMRAWVELGDGRKRSLLDIPQWDFNWQAEYRFERPVSVPAGATLAMEFTYNNSADNPRNPHRPPRRVLYGPESSDEMGDLWVQVVPKREADLAALQLDFARKETAARLAGYRFKLEMNPDDEEAHYSLAGMLAELGRTEEAIRHLEESMRIRPDFAMALSDLGRLHLLNGDMEQAVLLFGRAIAERFRRGAGTLPSRPLREARLSPRPLPARKRAGEDGGGRSRGAPLRHGYRDAAGLRSGSLQPGRGPRSSGKDRAGDAVSGTAIEP